MNHKINFKSSFKEPILLSGRIFGLKLLSAYEIIILERNYKTMLEISNLFKKNKTLLRKAGLISMCLYTASGERLFSNAVSVLKNLTCHEINYVFKQQNRAAIASLPRKKSINIWKCKKTWVSTKFTKFSKQWIIY